MRTRTLEGLTPYPLPLHEERNPRSRHIEPHFKKHPRIVRNNFIRA
ncbi:hypothetical protein B005_0667 [Nocardiopsis alba ATCC BAA-2165]|uniref:Uncharacterized protein n=1 Tax=Nocardiopsis alba (strain ATCC BAA-2165 / BE74) TaxID=1205910 RepID=J7LIF2_NOCAA|nr:hypothetical protein B005_0667 [Nocardiopsis alba ATCC BAA-2165]